MDPVVLAGAENSPLPGVVARAGGEDCVVLCDTTGGDTADTEDWLAL